MKQFLLAIFILLAFKTVNAQYHGDFNNKKIFISFGGEVGAPSNTPYNVSYGGYCQGELKPFDKVGITVAGEYVGYNYKSSLFTGTSTHPGISAVKAGLKYYTGPNFYFSGEIGPTLSNNYNTGNMLVYSLGFGFEIPVNKYSDVDVGFSYQNYSQSQYQTTALKVAYRIGW